MPTPPARTDRPAASLMPTGVPRDSRADLFIPPPLPAASPVLLDVPPLPAPSYAPPLLPEQEQSAFAGRVEKPAAKPRSSPERVARSQRPADHAEAIGKLLKARRALIREGLETGRAVADEIQEINATIGRLREADAESWYRYEHPHDGGRERGR